MEKIVSLNFGTSFMSTERETESCKVFVGFVLPYTGISNPGMDGWMEKASRKTTTTSFTICNVYFEGFSTAEKP
jgi:hypothetical protein